jgi:hypothetical protein
MRSSCEDGAHAHSVRLDASAEDVAQRADVLAARDAKGRERLAEVGLDDSPPSRVAQLDIESERADRLGTDPLALVDLAHDVVEPFAVGSERTAALALLQPPQAALHVAQLELKALDGGLGLTELLLESCPLDILVGELLLEARKLVADLLDV